MKIQNSNRRFRLISTTAIAAILLAGAPMVSADLGVDIGFQAAAKSCCFTAETLVRMADGSQRAIGDIREGDRVMGRSGTANTVTGIERVPLGERQLHGINDFTPFFTAEHPFLSPTGWRSVSPVLSRAETPGIKVGSLTAGDLLIAMVPGRPTIGATALDLAFDTCLITVSIITSMRIEEDLVVFNLLLDGDHTYIANDFVVHNKGGGEGGDSDSGGGEGGDSDSGGGEGGDSDSGGGEGGDSDSGGGERGDSDSSGGERGDDGESGESGDDGESGESGDDGESGESGDDGESGESGDDGESGESGDDGESGESGEGGSGGERGFDGSSEPSGPDLTRDQESDLISSGWN